ncbi:MAG: bifunctional hydroxymethylpyrimidine kinase/phosphomethylpyrimidine kinase [Nitrospirae bacterium]|nr:bifunctional hydroxymethylpyrimidine kinase/phosphomethylpyrimidine kinase [Nitrospirota bacterium]
MKSALTIAGSDPTGGAGLQADIKVFRAFGVHGLSVASVLTAQNTEGVTSILPVDKNFFAEQLNVLLKDMTPDAVKTGMLYSRQLVGAVAETIRRYSLKNLVIDPVTVSSSGVSLVEDGTLDAIREQLFPLAKVITPNIYEASVLTGISIENVTQMEEAAKELRKMGTENVVITGGHLEGEALDLYYDGFSFFRLESAKREGEYHGTGCAFSAAIAASLALGRTTLESVKKAKEFIDNAIKNAYHLGKGMRLLNL